MTILSPKWLLACFTLLAPALAVAQGEGITFYDSIGSNPTSLFPLTNTDGEARPVTNLLFESLLSRHWDTYEWQPELASKWEISPDGTQFTFTIDPKAKFSDGSPVTPEDVKFSFDVIFMDGVFTPSLKPSYEQIGKVEILGKDKVRFSAKDVFYQNFDVCASLIVFPKKHYMKMYAKDKTLAKAESTKEPLGSSQWLVEKWDDNQQIILKRNPNYWNKAKRILEGRWNWDRHLFKIIADSAVEFETFRKGDLTYLGLTPKQWTMQTNTPEFGTRIKKVQTTTKTAKGYNYIAWNNEHPILSNKDVRWALSHLVDLDTWNKKLSFGLNEPTVGPYSSKMEEHDPELKAVPFSLKDARKRLAAAGWSKAGPDGFLVKDGKKFEITVLYPVQAKETQEPRMALFKNQAAKVGVSILLKPVEWTSFTKLIDERKFDAVALAWGRSLDMNLKQ
ncbi:MAG: hypothetical protein IOD12_06435, partial [Silvanigrellales bacterium]|nr:hypothetical protein [Silvanigrellales bacterium]